MKGVLDKFVTDSLLDVSDIENVGDVPNAEQFWPLVDVSIAKVNKNDQKVAKYIEIAGLLPELENLEKIKTRVAKILKGLAPVTEQEIDELIIESGSSKSLGDGATASDEEVEKAITQSDQEKALLTTQLDLLSKVSGGAEIFASFKNPALATTAMFEEVVVNAPRPKSMVYDSPPSDAIPGDQYLKLDDSRIIEQVLNAKITVLNCANEAADQTVGAEWKAHVRRIIARELMAEDCAVLIATLDEHVTSGIFTEDVKNILATKLADPSNLAVAIENMKDAITATVNQKISITPLALQQYGSVANFPAAQV